VRAVHRRHAALPVGLRDAVCRQVSFSVNATNYSDKNTDEITDDARDAAMMENTKAQASPHRLPTDR
jgi:hypothetical protein